MTIEQNALDSEIRERAIKRLKQRRDFKGHVLVYLLVNSFLVVIWSITNSNGFFWPVFVMVGWGIGVVMNAYDVYFAQEIGEADIQREVDRLEHRG